MKRFLKGFYYAACGIVSCFKTERNMRVHFCAAFYVLIFMRFYDFTAAEKALIFLTIGTVISAEAMNTAIEAAADLITTEQNPLVKRAKDAAAGAVLISAIAAAAVGAVLFFDTAVIGHIFAWLSQNLWAAALLVLSAIAWIWIILRPCQSRKIKDKLKDPDYD